MSEKRDISSNDTYLITLHKLLPAELTAVHFALRAGASEQAILTPYFMGFSAFLALIFYFIAPYVLEIKRPINRLFYCITFLIWVVSVESATISTDIFTFGANDRTIFLYVVSSVAILWSFIVPYALLMFERMGKEAT